MAATHLKSPSAGFVNSILDVGVIHADPMILEALAAQTQ
jgi:hypothetical protein